jgi:prepilin-type processing-associated H-X9-DG protein
MGVSERLQGDWQQGAAAPGDVRMDLQARLNKSEVTYEDAFDACRQAPAGMALDSRGGETWFLTGLHWTSYTHTAPPNPAFLDCLLDSLDPGPMRDLDQLAGNRGVISARSHHPGGVNGLLLDGSVRFMRDGVSLPVWRAIATRAGGEVVDLDGL